MTDTLFADVSEFQPNVSAAYPYHFISFRSNDGTYQDHHFAANIAWAKAAVKANRISGFLVYFVWEPNWQQTIATFKAMVGTPDPKMAVMIDVESWGRIFGNQSAGINGAREDLIRWLGGNRARVIGYGNAGDLGSLWPTRGDAKIVLANYSSNPSFPGKIAHQFSDRYNIPPFGPCDVNSADGMSPEQFATALGLGTIPKPTPKPGPTPTPIPTPKAGSMNYVRFPDDATNPHSKDAVYATSGTALLWISLTDYRGLGSPPVSLIQPHTDSQIYKLPIVPGTPDPRSPGYKAPEPTKAAKPKAAKK